MRADRQAGAQGRWRLLVCFAVKEEARFFMNQMVYRLFPRYRLPGAMTSARRRNGRSIRSG